MTSEEQIERLIERLETDLRFARRWRELRRQSQAAETAGNARLAAELDRQAQRVVWSASRLQRAAARLTAVLDDIAADVRAKRQEDELIEAVNRSEQAAA